jgi:hypothetical protein
MMLVFGQRVCDPACGREAFQIACRSAWPIRNLYVWINDPDRNRIQQSLWVFGILDHSPVELASPTL